MAKFPMYIVNDSVPMVLKMNPNPNSISIDRSRVYNQTQTMGGWVFEHWGEKPRMLRVKGRTNAVLGEGAPGKNKEFAVESALFALQQLYTLDKRPLTDWIGSAGAAVASLVTSGQADAAVLKKLSSTFIYYKYDLYVGFFTDFKYEQVAENMPRHYEYEFEFLITASAQSVLTNTIFSSVAGSAVAGLASIASTAVTGNPKDLAAGAAILAGGKIIQGLSGSNT